VHFKSPEAPPEYLQEVVMTLVVPRTDRKPPPETHSIWPGLFLFYTQNLCN